LFGSEVPAGGVQVCKRETLINAPTIDWMEWQAGYVCSALLMPATHLRGVVGGYQRTHGLFGPMAIGSVHAAALIDPLKVLGDSAGVDVTGNRPRQVSSRPT
jgi:hypothetical protein